MAKRTIGNGRRPLCYHPDTLQIEVSETEVSQVREWAQRVTLVGESGGMDEKLQVAMCKYVMQLEQRLVGIMQVAGGNL